MSRYLYLALGFTMALGVWGCDDRRLDMRNIERIIAERYGQDTGVAVESVTCPALVPTRKGETFECRVRVQGAPDERVVVVEQLGGTQFRWQPAEIAPGPGAVETRPDPAK